MPVRVQPLSRRSVSIAATPAASPSPSPLASSYSRRGEANDETNDETNRDASDPHLAAAVSAISDPIRIVGYGFVDEDTEAATGVALGRKYTGNAAVSVVTAGTFETEGASWTCTGDSGGPAFNSAGALVGVTSIGPTGCPRSRSIYTSVARHLDLICAALPVGACPDDTSTTGDDTAGDDTAGDVAGDTAGDTANDSASETGFPSDDDDDDVDDDDDDDGDDDGAGCNVNSSGPHNPSASSLFTIALFSLFALSGRLRSAQS